MFALFAAFTSLLAPAHAQDVPPPIAQVQPAPTEIAPVAHRTAAIGRATTFSSAGLFAVTIIPSGLCALGGGGAGCLLSFVGTGIGGLGVGVGLTMEGVGSYAYLRRHRRLGGSGPGVGAGLGLILGGVGGIAAASLAGGDLYAVGFGGVGAIVAGVLVMDAQHLTMRRDAGLRRPWHPFVDPERSVVGFTGRF
jgi:hypothetical protein